MLQEGVGDHGHQCVTMKILPGSSLEVIKSEFFFQLLMRLFANPSCLDGGGKSGALHPTKACQRRNCCVARRRGNKATPRLRTLVSLTT